MRNILMAWCLASCMMQALKLIYGKIGSWLSIYGTSIRKTGKVFAPAHGKELSVRFSLVQLKSTRKICTTSVYVNRYAYIQSVWLARKSFRDVIFQIWNEHWKKNIRAQLSGIKYSIAGTVFFLYMQVWLLLIYQNVLVRWTINIPLHLSSASHLAFVNAKELRQTTDGSDWTVCVCVSVWVVAEWSATSNPRGSGESWTKIDLYG